LQGLVEPGDPLERLARARVVQEGELRSGLPIGDVAFQHRVVDVGQHAEASGLGNAQHPLQEDLACARRPRFGDFPWRSAGLSRRQGQRPVPFLVAAGATVLATEGDLDVDAGDRLAVEPAPGVAQVSPPAVVAARAAGQGATQDAPGQAAAACVQHAAIGDEL
jgi:hypothetical protein